MAASRRSAAPRGTRIEKDLLGKRAVPADALYGIQTVRAVENLGFSGRILANYPDYIRALATVKKAAARANRDAHVIDARRLDAIEACVRRADSRRTSCAVSSRHAGRRWKYRRQHELERGHRESRQRASRRCPRNLSTGASEATRQRFAIDGRRLPYRGSHDGAEPVARIASRAGRMRCGIPRQGRGAAAGHHDLAHLPAGCLARVARRNLRRPRRSDRAACRRTITEHSSTRADKPGRHSHWLWKRSIGDLSARHPEAAERTRRAKAYAAPQSLRRGAEYRRSRGGVRATRDARGSDD